MTQITAYSNSDGRCSLEVTPKSPKNVPRPLSSTGCRYALRNSKQTCETLIKFPPTDAKNPINWSNACLVYPAPPPFSRFFLPQLIDGKGRGKKSFIFVTGIVLTLNSTIGSALPSGSIKYVTTAFDITNQTQLVLPISVFLIGYVVFPQFLGPLRVCLEIFLQTPRSGDV
jgi:hypothetical protein